MFTLCSILAYKIYDWANFPLSAGCPCLVDTEKRVDYFKILNFLGPLTLATALRVFIYHFCPRPLLSISYNNHRNKRFTGKETATLF